ncbi:MAG: serine/threonine protein kinase [Archangium sp.]|nr:serine/threonine protein kinase [Archangium sp.]
MMRPPDDDAGLLDTVGSASPGKPPPLPNEVVLTLRPESLLVRSTLGEGGMGRVLLAEERGLDREVAVKVLKDGNASNVDSLLHEARVLGALAHPGVLPVYGLASDPHGAPALVMKRIEGVSWRQLLDERREGDQLAANLEVLKQVCNAVAFAHRRGILHRDLKPANVLLGDFGEVLVADWGLAIRKSDAARVKNPVGTPAYMAPEMVRGEPLTEATDVFLLGATLYELLAGHPPFLSDSLETALALAKDAMAPPLPRSVPSELASVCQRAMSLRGEDRPTATGLRDALDAYLTHRGALAIASATTSRLEALELAVKEKGGDLRVHPLLSECRFGFSQALASWPQCPPALEGKERTLRLGIEHEVRNDRPAAARALMVELRDVAPELEKSVQDAEKREADARVRAAALRKLARDLDPNVGRRARIIFIVLMVMLMVSFNLLRFLVPSLYATRWALPISSLAFFFAACVLVAFFWRVVFSSKLNRQLAAFVGAMTLGQVALRSVAAAYELPRLTTLGLDLAVIFTAWLIGGVVLHWTFLCAAGVLVCGQIGAALQPQFADKYFGASTAGAVIVVGLLSRYWRSSTPALLPPPR